MATWQKIIFSGSNAQVASTTISGHPNPDIASLQVDGSDIEVLFPNLETGTSEILAAAVSGTVVISANGSHLMVTHPAADVDDPVTGIQKLPYNPRRGYDFSGDGEIGSADLLGFLVAYGTHHSEDDFNHELDINYDGEIGSADLLGFLVAYGHTIEELSADGDSRPSINWTGGDYDWIDTDVTSPTYNSVTAASVKAYYNALLAASGSSADSIFWNNILPHSTNFYDDGTQFPLIDSNVKAYLEQRGATATIDLFTYVYFDQTTGNNTTYTPGIEYQGGDSSFAASSYSGIYP
jgi:hypothetical protein